MTLRYANAYEHRRSMRPVVLGWLPKIIGAGQKNNLFDRGLLKPRKLLEGQQKLLVAEQQPEAMLGNVGNLRRRSDRSRHFESPRYEARQWHVPREAAAAKDRLR